MKETKQLVDLLEDCETLKSVFEALKGWDVHKTVLHPNRAVHTYKVLAGHDEYAVLERTMCNTSGQPKHPVVNPYGSDVIYLFSK